MIINSYVRRYVQSKGTLQIPAEMQDEFRGDIVITVRESGHLSLHTLSHFEKIEKYFSSISHENKATRHLARLIIGSATETYADKRGRLNIPNPLKEFSGIDGDIAILCVGNEARLLPKEKWEQLHRTPNSEESRSKLKSLSLPFKSRRMDTVAEFVEPVKEVLQQKYKDLLECHASRNYRKFELLIAEIFDCHEVGIIEVTQYSNDGGVDLIIYFDSDFGIEVLFVQVKAGNSLASVSDIRELICAISLRNGNAGLLVSFAGFTFGARNESQRSLSTRIKASITDAYKLSNWIETRLSVI